MILKKIISGGQTGVDQLALRIGKHLGLETGGTAPKNFKTETGLEYKLESYGLTQHFSDEYSPRTRCNVQDSDGTVLFGDMKSPGSRQTIMMCLQEKKPYICNPSVPELVNFCEMLEIKTLNVAGNRQSKLSKDDEEYCIETLMGAISELQHELPF